MSVENSANNISQLNPNWPTAEDFVSEGDDHLRLIKKTVKQTFPNIKDIVNISHKQLNSLAKIIPTEDTKDDIVINGSLTVHKDGYVEVGKADFKLSEMVDKTAINLKMLRELTMPVGHIAILNVATNPKDLYGFGEWAATGQGRVLIGVGTGTDSRNEAKAFTLGQTAGEFNHVLTANELAAHTHGAGGLTTASAGSHNHATNWALVGEDGSGSGNLASGGWGGPEDTFRTPTQNGGEHTHTVTGETATAGGNAAHNIMQPYLVVHMWVRTA